MAALSNVAGGLWVLEVLDSSTALFLLKKGDVAAAGWVMAWRLLPQITLKYLHKQVTEFDREIGLCTRA